MNRALPLDFDVRDDTVGATLPCSLQEALCAILLALVLRLELNMMVGINEISRLFVQYKTCPNYWNQQSFLFGWWMDWFTAVK